MKIWLLIIALLIAAYAYGWRFHPQEIPKYFPWKHSTDRKPVFTQEKNKNAMSHWHPDEFLDNFNGNKEWREAHPQQNK